MESIVMDHGVKIRKLASTGAMHELMADYFAELDDASRNGSSKIAWCTSVGPAELLRAFGFKVYFPENHGAMLGASRMATELIPAANAIGYSPDICSYLTSDIGSHLRRQTPLTGAYGMDAVPKPDVLVYNTNQCRDVRDWFDFYRREFDAPLVGIDAPRNVGEITKGHIQGLIGQYRAMIPTIEQVSGVRFDPDRLKETVRSSYDCSLAWKKVLRLAEQRPSPITFFDAAIHMGPAVVLRGDDRAVEYYDSLLAELEGRVVEGTGAVDGEGLRFYWEGMPVWGRLRDHAEFFASRHVCVAASTYCNSWVFEDLGLRDPFEAMARAYTELFIVRSEGLKQEYLESMVRDFGIDGIVFHDARTCPNNSNNRYGMPQRLADRTGIPYVVIDGDLNDLRMYSDRQSRTRLEALIEQITDNGKR